MTWFATSTQHSIAITRWYLAFPILSGLTKKASRGTARKRSKDVDIPAQVREHLVEPNLVDHA
jgi:hypothetical protein